MIWCARVASSRAPLNLLSRHFSLSCRPRFPRSVHDVPVQKSVPSFREQVARVSPVKSFSEAVKHPVIGKHIVFVSAASLLAFAVAAENTNVTTEFWSRYLNAPTRWSHSTPTTADMRLAQATLLLKAGHLNTLSETLADAPIIIKSVVLHTYARVGEAYINASEGRRVGWGICAVNVAVWVAWQIPRLRPFMHVHFAHNPLSGKTYTMLTSMFSHASFFHLFFNCMALTSFGSATSTWLTREQNHAPSRLQEATASYHFLAFYLSAGLFSSLVSHVVTTRIIFPRLVAKLAQSPPPAPTTLSSLSSSLHSAAKAPALAPVATTTATATTAAAETVVTPASAILPSLGASGAIYGTVVISALAFPEAQVGLIFPPTPSFPIQYGVGALFLVDCVGALRGWRLFDHYAHLGGAAFGGLYYAYGMDWWDKVRVSLHSKRA
ncbi:rhomboid-domain-containing protein [Artomyces pyxidatus]|uniref:Rhomboid-domain-containing protein n=1 Tax=Artomyces pyxidatus TaxID=48021 RepID=A0ACB8SN60_9AGAM|nr:rhomboid-domain-containing protein [Artomyces pyxidatus]